MAKVSAINRNSFSVRKTPDHIPIHLIVPEAGPPMGFRFSHKFIPRSPSRSKEKRLASVGIVKCYFAACFGLLFQEISEFPVSGVFRVMAIKVTDAISNLPIAIPSQIFLNGSFRSPMGFGGHDGLLSHHAGRRIVPFLEHIEHGGEWCRSSRCSYTRAEGKATSRGGAETEKSNKNCESECAHIFV